MIGPCAICNETKELTFEHVPPRSAFNNKPIFIQLADNLIEKSSKLFGKRRKSHKGFGSYSLCKTCNNNTGVWYAKDFIDFANQGMEILKLKENPGYVKGQYTIKPLNVLKQILTMFMSADKSGVLKDDYALINFILDKYSTDLPNKYKIYIYSNASSMKRMMGYTVVADPILGICKWSEINFQPFGYLLAIDSGPAHKTMVDITDFHKYKYDDKFKITITTPYLRVTSPWIGSYE